jgi:hypothetical protein
MSINSSPCNQRRIFGCVSCVLRASSLVLVRSWPSEMPRRSWGIGHVREHPSLGPDLRLRAVQKRRQTADGEGTLGTIAKHTRRVAGTHVRCATRRPCWGAVSVAPPAVAPRRSAGCQGHWHAPTTIWPRPARPRETRSVNSLSAAKVAGLIRRRPFAARSHSPCNCSRYRL